ncbi:MAG: Gfo/Idh/MocA family oxidoreductase, partial [Candidatus Zixiibacteriota bacterium]
MTQTERFKKAENHGITRRQFLGRTAALSGVIAAPWIIPSSVLGAEGNVAPSERITVGLIGHGIMGRGHLRRLAGDRDFQVMAVCDVDGMRCQQAKNRVEETYASKRPDDTYKGCDAYNDYRELLARPDIDAVVIVTPDHWHTPQSIDAVKAGKDVYCEKPITITVQQGRRLVETVQRYGRVFQTG